MPDDKPGKTEKVFFTLPSGEEVSGDVPAGMSDDQTRTYLRSRHPEFFPQQATPGQAAPAAAAPTAGAQAPPGIMDRISAAGKALMGRAEDYLSASQPSASFGTGIGENLKAQEAKLSEAPEAISALLRPQGGGSVTDVMSHPRSVSLFDPQTGAFRPRSEALSSMANTALGMGRTAGRSYEGLLGALNPFVSAPQRPGQTWLSHIAESAGASAPNIAMLLTGGMGPLKDVLGSTAEFQSGLEPSASDIATRGARQIDGLIKQAQKRQGWRTASMINDVSSADYQTGSPAISLADMWNDVKAAAEQFKAGGKTTPKFNAVSNVITSRADPESPTYDPSPNFWWKQVHDLKQEVGDLAAGASPKSRDAAASNSVRAALDQKLTDRANAIDRSESNASYKKWWSQKNVDDKLILGMLDDAKNNGRDYFNIIKHPDNVSNFTRALDNLEEFGLDKDQVQQIITSHEPVVKFLNGRRGMGGRIGAIQNEPAAGTAGAAVGGVVGGATQVPGGRWMGSTIGAINAARLAERIKAVRAMQRLGGPPSLVGELAGARNVMPKGSGAIVSAPETEQAAPAPQPQFAAAGNSQADVESALRNLGYKQAKSMAAAAVKQHPGDFDAAVRAALSASKSKPND